MNCGRAMQEVVVADEGRGQVPLAVDLDGTLCRSDTLHDAVIQLLIRRPFYFFSLMAALIKGKAAFKARLADLFTVDPTLLPYDSNVLELVRGARSEGRMTILISASDERVVKAVSDYLGLFDCAVGTGGWGTDDKNLSGEAKAQWLSARFGVRGYDYVGDSEVDLRVWSKARRALVVRTSRRLEDAASRLGLFLEELGPRAPSMGDWVRLQFRALRPHQWAKNLLVFVPLLAAHNFSEMLTALAAFLAFCMTASAAYIFNDLADIDADRSHPRKCLRPFAAGQISVIHGLVLASSLLVLAFGLALYFAPISFAGILAGYLITTVGYSFWLKRCTIVDIITLAGLYTLRILGGGVAAGVSLSYWLMAFSMFLFFSLAAIKRQAELVDMDRNGREAMRGRGYVVSDLPVIRSMAITSGQAAVLVLALYVTSQDVVLLYSQPNILWLLSPVVFYWLSRIQLLTHRGFMVDDPVVFALRDKRSLMAGVAFFVLLVLAAVGLEWS